MRWLRHWLYRFTDAYNREKWVETENRYLRKIKELEADNLGLRKYIQGVHVGLTRGRR